MRIVANSKEDYCKLATLTGFMVHKSMLRRVVRIRPKDTYPIKLILPDGTDPIWIRPTRVSTYVEVGKIEGKHTMMSNNSWGGPGNYYDLKKCKLTYLEEYDAEGVYLRESINPEGPGKKVTESISAEELLGKLLVKDAEGNSIWGIPIHDKDDKGRVILVVEALGTRIKVMGVNECLGF